MSFTAQDLKRLQIPLLTMGVAIIVATLFYSATDARLEKTRQQLQQQQNALNQARSRYQASGTEKETIVKYLPAYQKLIERGFIGEEQRVDWIDDLRTVNLENKLFGVSYDIGAMTDFKPAFALDAGNFKLHRSTMKITFAMLHEGDLHMLFEDLPSKKNAPFLVRSCVVDRMPGGGKAKFLPNLNTTCEVDWLTLVEPVSAGGKP